MITGKVCEVCGKPLKPIFKATPKQEDWIYPSCDTCLEDVCEKCSDTNDEGYIQCSMCYQNEAICREFGYQS